MEEVHRGVGEQLTRVGQRYTTQRRSLVEALSSAGGPLSVGDLRDRTGLPQSSVYRNLAVLEQAGAIRRVLGSGEAAHVELAEDHTEHHHHLVCLCCGTVTDYRLSEGVERTMERAVTEVAAETGFRTEGHRLDLVGTCRSCLE